MKTLLMAAAILAISTGTSMAGFTVPKADRAEIRAGCNEVFSDEIAQGICLKKEIRARKKMNRYTTKINYLDDLTAEEIATNDLWSVLAACTTWHKDEAGYEMTFRVMRCVKIRNKSANLSIATPRRAAKRLRRN